MSGKHFIVYDLASGALRWRGQGDASEQVLDAGMGIIAVSAASYDAYAAGAASLPIAEIRSVLWQQVKARRAAARDGGAATPLGAVDSQETEDVPARTNILGTTLAATIAKMNSAPFAVTWTMLDNSEPTLDADQMISVGLAVLAHVNACYDRARSLRAQIDAAQDITELLSIDINAGWPA